MFFGKPMAEAIFSRKINPSFLKHNRREIPPGMQVLIAEHKANRGSLFFAVAYRHN
jgi:hypothetical protein